MSVATTPIPAAAPVPGSAAVPTSSADRRAGRSIRDIADDLRTGRTTSVDLVERFLDAVASPGGRALNAFAYVDAHGARAAAREADRLRAAGHGGGLLHGVPVAVKDMIDVAGMPTRAGSAHFAGRGPADADADCVGRLRRAGAIVVGKTTTHEFAYGPTGDRSADGPSRNPHAPDRMSGGSSGGSAVAVAAGLVPYALGTDTGGSVRIPAALCGVTGFKPAHGAVATQGVVPLAPSLDHVGVIARDARDCLLVARALGALPGAAAGSTGLPYRPLRIGWLAPADPVDPAVAAAVRGALERAVGPVAEVSWPARHTWSDAMHAFTAVQSREVIAYHGERLDQAPELFDPEVLRRLRVAAATAAADVGEGDRLRAALRSAARDLCSRFDVLASPTAPITAPRCGAREVIANGRVVDVREALLSLTSVWNLVGLPAFSIPAGSLGGLPVGLHLVVRPGGEHRAAELAARISGGDG
ncbi:amidase [Yinghuangia sp. YIM S09857]|uniref:amidase n=1 Tax=Yinghuangia sp. YIM S09857 TaxID=3436929 RepID=UPI003F533E8B